MPFDPDAVREFERAGWQRAAARYEASFATATGCFVAALLDAAGVPACGRDSADQRPGDAWRAASADAASDTARHVLDVACGPGIVTAAAAGRGAAARGLDFSDAMLAVARTRHPALRFDQGDAEALPYPDAAFDAVVSNFGIHHVPHPVRALREAHRVLRPGGRLAFTIWAAPAENVAWKLVFDAVGRCGDPAASKAPAPGGGFGSAADCEAALREAGFEGIETRTLRATWRHADGGALLTALRQGTARMAALIEAQEAAALPAIITAIDAGSAPYRDAGGIAVPIAAVVAAGRKG